MYTISKSRAKSEPYKPNLSGSDPLPDLIGGPPETGSNIAATKNLMDNSGIRLIIQPCVPTSQTGLSLFILDVAQGWEKYKKCLNDVNFHPTPSQCTSKGITVICQAENFPTDNFQNDYGESFLNQLTEVASSGFGQLAQMFGKENATEAMIAGGQLGKDAASQIGGIFGNVLSAAAGGLESFGHGARDYVNSMKKEPGIKGTIGATMDRLLAGARIDFPMIWKGSAYSPTFSCSIKLYNPNPASNTATKKYIVAPLAALLTLALPRSEDMNSYNYPFFCKVDCPGLFKIESGAISNISVVKGGDTGLIGFNQRVSMVDVKIDFVNLHSTLLLSNHGVDLRPTLRGYLLNMLNGTDVEKIYEDKKTMVASADIYSVPSQPITVASDLSDPPPSRIEDDKIEEETAIVNNDTSGFYDTAVA